MSRAVGRARRCLRMVLVASAMAAVGCLAAQPVVAKVGATHEATRAAPAANSAGKRAAASARRHARSGNVRLAKRHAGAVGTAAAAAESGHATSSLSFSDEFERAELVEEMLKECRGVPYNAYELAQSSGEPLWMPAPIQLVVIRIDHPFCAELLREYAPRVGV